MYTYTACSNTQICDVQHKFTTHSFRDLKKIILTIGRIKRMEKVRYKLDVYEHM